MPIRPENRALYPSDWKAISLEVRKAAGWRCEGSPAFPDCRAEGGKPHPVTGSLVVLTVAHLDHQPENCDRSNLKAWCQRRHNTYDMPMRRAGIASRARQALGVVDMFETHHHCQSGCEKAQAERNASNEWVCARCGSAWIPCSPETCA